MGQIFEDGTVEFREKLVMYSLETGYKYKFVQNEKARVAVKYIHKKEKGCKWRIHTSQKLRMDGLL